MRTEITDELVEQVARANEPGVWADDFEREAVEDYPDGEAYVEYHRTRTLREARHQLELSYSVIAAWTLERAAEKWGKHDLTTTWADVRGDLLDDAFELRGGYPV